jgi:hypothetical protein
MLEVWQREMRMGKLAIQLSMLAIGATALVVVPAIASVEAKTTSRHLHVRKHRWQHHYVAAWPVGPAQPVVRSYDDGSICPAIGKSFDCKIWPPPFADDPDRKTSRY